MAGDGTITTDGPGSWRPKGLPKNTYSLLGSMTKLTMPTISLIGVEFIGDFFVGIVETCRQDADKMPTEAGGSR